MNLVQGRVEDFIYALFKSSVIEKMIKSALSMNVRILYVSLMKPTEHNWNILERYSLARIQMKI